MKINREMQRLIDAIPAGAKNIVVLFSERKVAGFDCSGTHVFEKNDADSMHKFIYEISKAHVGQMQELIYDLDGVHHEICMNEHILCYWKTFEDAIKNAREIQ